MPSYPEEQARRIDMKAPDKCYITREKNGVIYSLSFNDNGGLEYIRKDALMEWINEARAIHHENAITRDLAFQEVVNKLNSM